MRLLVVRCLAFEVVQALMRALVKDGALCSTVAGRCSVLLESVRSVGTE